MAKTPAAPIQLREAARAVQSIPLNQVRVPNRRIRQVMDRSALEDLAASMSQHSQLQPILVRRQGNRYRLIAGERRLQAARLLGWSAIDALTVEADDVQAHVLEIVENLQREDVSPAEEADAFVELMQVNDWTLREVAAAVSRSVAYVSKRTRIFQDLGLRTAVIERGLSLSAAEELLAIEPPKRDELLARAVDEGWPFARIREAVREVVEGPRPAPAEDEQVDQLFGVEPAADDGDPIPEIRDFRVEKTPVLGRPPGLDRQAREFLDLLMQVTPESLTDRDKRVLTRIWETIGLLARAAPKRGRVIPPLPTG